MNVKKNDINDTFEIVSNNVNKYIKFKDDFIDDDYLEILDDNIALLRGLSSVYKLVAKKRLAHFLKGLSFKNGLSDEQLKMFADYIDNENKAEFIASAIETVVKSSSKKAAFLIGLIGQEIINSNEEIDFKHLICINGLSDFFDYDIDNLIIIKKYLNTKTRGRYFYPTGIKNWCIKNNIYCDNSILLTIEKCVSNQFVNKEYDTDIRIDEDDPSYSSAETSEDYLLSEPGEFLFLYLEYLKVYD